MKKIVIVGTGGLAREFSSYFSEYAKIVSIIGFSSTNLEEHRLFSLPGKLFEGEITPEKVDTDEVVIAIGSPTVKKRITERLKNLGFAFPSFIHPSSVVSDRAIYGEGVIVSPNCTVSPNVELKDFCYLNFGVGVGHDATLGSFSQINPGVQLGGFSTVGDGTLIGSGSTVLQGVNIGSGVTIASGSVVFSRVADGAIMMGNPAKRMRAFEK
jgi:sugar O-acyltransferase (sialic acid O-acetyltransferase NeuD family)